MQKALIPPRHISVLLNQVQSLRCKSVPPEAPHHSPETKMFFAATQVSKVIAPPPPPALPESRTPLRVEPGENITCAAPREGFQVIWEVCSVFLRTESLACSSVKRKGELLVLWVSLREQAARKWSQVSELKFLNTCREWLTTKVPPCISSWERQGARARWGWVAPPKRASFSSPAPGHEGSCYSALLPSSSLCISSCFPSFPLCLLQKLPSR